MTSLHNLQTAIYAELTGDEALMSMISGVFDAVPDGQALPYIVIGDATETPWSTFGRSGSDDVLTIHIWSQANGFKGALQVLDQLNALLDGGELEMSGHVHVGTLYEGAETLRDPDGVTRHAVARYRAYVQRS